MPNGRSTADPARHRGPSLVAVAATYVALFLASVVLPTVVANGQHFPSPFERLDASDRFFAEHSKAVHLMAFLQFGAAVPLGIFAAAATSRVQFLGLKVAGTNIAFFGGDRRESRVGVLSVCRVGCLATRHCRLCGDRTSAPSPLLRRRRAWLRRSIRPPGGRDLSRGWSSAIHLAVPDVVRPGDGRSRRAVDRRVHHSGGCGPVAAGALRRVRMDAARRRNAAEEQRDIEDARIEGTRPWPI